MAHSFLRRPVTYLGNQIGNIFAPGVERGIEILSPTWANERALARAMRVPDAELTELARIAANPRGAWRQASIADTGSSESTRAQRERITMMWESRECIQNFGFMKALALGFGRYVLGKILYLADTGDIGRNALQEDYIAEWFLRENCDVTGRFPFRKLMEMGYVGHKIDGDAGIVPTLLDGDIRLQVVQGDRIGNPFNYDYVEGYYSGVITDEIGRPTDYEIFRRMRNNIYLDPQTVPRSNFLHILNPLNADQYRGITTNDDAIAPARQIFNIFQNEMRAVNALSGQTALVSSKGNAAGAKWIQEQKALVAAAQAAGVPPPQMPSQEIKPGTINYIADGDNITAFTYNRPSPAFNGLFEANLKEICDSWCADFNFFRGGEARGANIRLGSSQMSRVFHAELHELMVPQAIKPLIKLKLQFGMAMGHIPAGPDWDKMHIIGGRDATCDNGNDVDADIKNIQMGITTLDQIVLRNGDGPVQIDQHISRLGATAQKITQEATDRGVPVNMIQQRTPNGNGQDPQAGGNGGGGDGSSGGGGSGGGGSTRPTVDNNPPTAPANGISEMEAWLNELPDDVKARLTELREIKRDAHGKFTFDDNAKWRFGHHFRHAAAIERGARKGAGIAKDLHGLAKDLVGRHAATHHGRAGNFVVKDPHAKSVRVYFDPSKKGPRHRRNKRFYEKVSFKRKIAKALIAAGLLAVSAAVTEGQIKRREKRNVPNFKSSSGKGDPVKETMKVTENPASTGTTVGPAGDMPAGNIATKRKGTIQKPGDVLYGKNPKMRNRVTTRQQVKHKKGPGESGSSLSLEQPSGKDKSKAV